MTSFTEKDLFTIFVELDKKGQLQLSEVNAVIKGKLNNTEVLEELDSIEKLLRNYRKLKSNHHKSKGYDYIVNLGSREIMLTAYENNIPQITREQKVYVNQMPIQPAQKPIKPFIGYFTYSILHWTDQC